MSSMLKPSKDLQSVADYFLASAKNSSSNITNKQLQKLAYYAHAWNLVFNNREKLFTEPIEAWVHGPAIRNLYNKYRTFGYLPITQEVEMPKDLNPKNQAILDDVWDVYGKYDGDYLELLTHSEQPWINARGNAVSNQPTSTVITDDAMYAFYSALR